VLEFALAVLLGRLRKARQALVLRHRGSLASLMVRRYASKPFLRSSVSCGFDVVRENHDFRGSEAGGVAPLCEVRLSWRVVKSEYLFWTVNERSGSLKVIL